MFFSRVQRSYLIRKQASTFCATKWIEQNQINILVLLNLFRLFLLSYSFGASLRFCFRIVLTIWSTSVLLPVLKNTKAFFRHILLIPYTSSRQRSSACSSFNKVTNFLPSFPWHWFCPYNIVKLGMIVVSLALFLLEVLSNLIRLVSLTVRITANLTCGHLIIFLVAVLIKKGFCLNFSYHTLLTFFRLAFCIAIIVLELRVAIVQGVVFALLSSIYIDIGWTLN